MFSISSSRFDVLNRVLVSSLLRNRVKGPQEWECSMPLMMSYFCNMEFVMNFRKLPRSRSVSTKPHHLNRTATLKLTGRSLETSSFLRFSVAFVSLHFR